MNEKYGLTAKNILSSLPQVLADDAKLYALAEITADLLAARLEEIDRIRIYNRIDELPEDLLDILAYDFKVDWWDYTYSLEQKRQTLKDSFLVHKRLGTKYAVETAISAIYPEAKVEEWYEYGGEPYRFRLAVDVSHELVDSDHHVRVLSRVNYYKNLRSHLDGITYTMVADEPAYVRHGGFFASIVQMPVPELQDSIAFAGTVRVGTGRGSHVLGRIPVPERRDNLRFAGEVHTGGHGGVTTTTMPIPELRGE